MIGKNGMAEITLLKDELVDKIAAGEVVERPASVLKELIENAVDAGADRIDIELEEGGTKLIGITDNGRGILPGELQMAVRRHATSKIKDLDDLFQIRTMGFRGEALASIAAVSRFGLKSRHHAATDGASLEIFGDESTETGWNGPVGTSVVVKDLFYNVPARKRFLKTRSMEYSLCTEMVRNLALSYPHVTFTLKHDGKDVYYWEGQKVGGDEPFKGEDVLWGRLGAMLPANLHNDKFLYLRKEGRLCRIEGLISPPGMDRQNAKYLFSFVNDRWVKDRNLRYSILRGYHSHLLKGRFPLAVLYIYSDPSLIDVNVHPAKTEVKFQYDGEIQSFIASAISQRIREADWGRSPSVHEESPQVSYTPPTRESFATADAVRPIPSAYARPTERTWSAGRSKEPEVRVTQRTSEAPLFASLGYAQDLPVSHGEDTRPVNWEQMKHVGSFAQCYLFFEDAENLLVVDQHAFHERILYEKLMADPSAYLKTQPLVFPETVSVDPSMAAIFGEHSDLLKQWGFDTKVASQQDVEILGVPTVLVNRDIEAAINQLGEVMQNGGKHAGGVAEISHDIFATMACHAAVRAGEELNSDDVTSLLRQATEVDFYHNCPHGRRVLRWFAKREVENWFDRNK
jgi:DNA mismatch repair protein MutL